MDWQAPYVVRIAKMDRQHRKIVKILGRIGYLEADDRQGLEQIFGALTACLCRHFTDEESLLRVHDYPGYEEQKREHERFADRIGAFEKQFRKGVSPEMIGIFTAVLDWFALHVLLQDKQYEPFLTAKGCQ
jgi:hemerythrin